MDLFYILNALFAYLCLRWAFDDFAEGKNGAGYFNLFLSAFNAAVIMNGVIQ